MLLPSIYVMEYKTSNLTSAALLTRPVVVPSSDTAYSPSTCFSLEKVMDGMGNGTDEDIQK